MDTVHAAPLLIPCTAVTFDPFHLYLYPLVPCGWDEVKVESAYREGS